MLWIGLQKEGSAIKIARLGKIEGKIVIDSLKTIPLENIENVKPLYIEESYITGLDSKEIILKTIPLKRT